MISLCNSEESVNLALNEVKGTSFIRENIRLYLNSYSTQYEFAQYYLQYSNETNEPVAVVLRYNNQIYVLVDERSDIGELSAFLQGFSGCDVVADNLIGDHFENIKECFVYEINGKKCADMSDNIKVVTSPKEISTLVTKDFDEKSKMDFFLNTAHQLRHNCISVFGCYAGEKLAAVVSASLAFNEYSVITFVYTDEYFRGNGYAQDLLKAVCTDDSLRYVLLCEEHNNKFYEKCGFKQISVCSSFDL